MKHRALFTSIRLALASLVASAGLRSTDVDYGFRCDHAATMEDLQNKLLNLNDTARNIQAVADSENRQLTNEEAADLDSIFAAFEDTKTEIARRNRLNEINNELRTPARGRQSGHDEELDPPAPAARAQGAPTPRQAPPAPRTARVEAMEDRNKWGFRSFGEYAMSVRAAAARGGSVDPRLIANAPTTFSQEGVGADGGFAVPPDFRTEIMKKVLGENTLISRTDQQQTSSNSFTVPMDETTPWQSTGGIQAYWESEASQLTQSKIALTEVTTKLNKLTALVPVTEELLADASAIASYLRSKAPQKMDFKITNAIVRGSGAGQPLGFLNSPALITVTPQSGQAADTIRFDNILDMWSRMYSGCRASAVWLVNQDVETQLMRMSFRDATSSPVPVYIPPGGLSGSPYGTLLGRPVIVSEAASELGSVGDISLIDFGTYLSVIKTGGIRSDISIHLWFDYDVTAFRFIMRVGGQPWWRSTIARAFGSTTLSCFVTLGERA